jgi:Uma2 family endonuclease
MPEPKRVDWSLEEFLVWEASQPERYEFVGGTPRMMTGGTQAHTAISINLTSVLREKLRGTPCRPGGSDLRVPIPATGQSRYPDAQIDCGKFEPTSHDASVPTVVFEVLSKSNDLRDQHGRLRDYDSVATIRHYVVIAQSEAVVVIYDRDEAGRLAPGAMLTEATAALDLPAVGMTLDLDEIYEGLDVFPTS